MTGNNSRLCGLILLVTGFGLIIAGCADGGLSGQVDDQLATEEDKKFIRRSYELARAAAILGDAPYGALLAYKGKIIAEFQNEVITSKDVTQHAETGLIRIVSGKFDATVLADSILYASSEPCVMCAGAIRWTHIGKVVYGLSARTQGQTNRSIPARVLLGKIAPGVQVVGPLLEREGLEMLKSLQNSD